MEKTILTQTLHLDTAPVHIAPGGSILCHLTAKADSMAKLLHGLMEEIAFGMSDVETVDAGNQIIRVDIYFGTADMDDFMKVYGLHADKISSFEQVDLPDGTQKTGFTMQARNLVIRTLG